MELESSRRSVGITKELTEGLDMSYAVEQSQEDGVNAVETTQRIGGSVKINQNITLEAEKEIIQDSQKLEEGTVKTDDKVWLKFKQKF